MFTNQYGAPKPLIHDGSSEQVGRKTVFQSIKRNYGIATQLKESHRPSQNPANGAIRE